MIDVLARGRGGVGAFEEANLPELKGRAAMLTI